MAFHDAHRHGDARASPDGSRLRHPRLPLQLGTWRGVNASIRRGTSPVPSMRISSANLSGKKPVSTAGIPCRMPPFSLTRSAASEIDARVQVVAYDQDSGMYASRLWWMLRWLGHDAARRARRRLRPVDRGRPCDGVRPRDPSSLDSSPCASSGAMTATVDDVAGIRRRADWRRVDAQRT